MDSGHDQSTWSNDYNSWTTEQLAQWAREELQRREQTRQCPQTTIRGTGPEINCHAVNGYLPVRIELDVFIGENASGCQQMNQPVRIVPHFQSYYYHQQQQQPGDLYANGPPPRGDSSQQPDRSQAATFGKHACSSQEAQPSGECADKVKEEVEEEEEEEEEPQADPGVSQHQQQIAEIPVSPATKRQSSAGQKRRSNALRVAEGVEKRRRSVGVPQKGKQQPRSIKQQPRSVRAPAPEQERIDSQISQIKDLRFWNLNKMDPSMQIDLKRWANDELYNDPLEWQSWNAITFGAWTKLVGLTPDESELLLHRGINGANVVDFLTPEWTKQSEISYESHRLLRHSVFLLIRKADLEKREFANRQIWARLSGDCRKGSTSHHPAAAGCAPLTKALSVTDKPV